MNKNIIGLLSLIALCNWNVNAQNQVQKSKIIESYNRSETGEKRATIINKIASEQQEAYEKAKAENRPISGVTADGRLYALQRVDEFGNYIYYTTSNMGSRVMSRVSDIAPGGSLGMNLNGKDITVGVWDGASALGTHVEFKGKNGASRVEMKDATPDLAAMNQAQLRRFVRGMSHATHVTGTIGAKGVDVKATGMAPEATIVSYNWDDDIEKMDQEVSLNGLLVSNHSYGMAAIGDDGTIYAQPYYFGSYDYSAYVYDWITHTYKYYQPVVAAGNDQDDFSILNPTKNGADMLLGNTVSKNVIVVGAVEQVSYYNGPASVKIAYFSSNGPTNDFRIKPDITAKGVGVYSSYYSLPNPVSGIPQTNVYAPSSGTSMAAPAVTGIIALWQQWAMENKEMPLKSATVRALMTHTASEAGTAPGPDHIFGWGLINAKAGVQILVGSKVNGAVVEESELRQGQDVAREFVVAEGGAKFIATLAWTDPEGEFGRGSFDEDYAMTNPSLVNDLDLRVYKDGEEYFPWRLNKDFANLVAQKGDNDVDNIEKIEIETAEAGTYTVVVSHKNSLEGGVQEYTLIMSTGDFNNLSTEEFELEDSLFSIWPNPVTEILNINVPEEADLTGMSVELFDLSGRRVKTMTNITANQVEVDVRGLSSGVYVVKIKGKGFEKTERIVKK